MAHSGHGGFDGGAVVGDVLEKNINLAIANTLSDMLQLSGIDVIKTRSDDSSTESDPSLSTSARKKSDLRNRLSIINSHPDGIFVSIHLNKFPSSSAKGAQIFYGTNNENSGILAENIRQSIVNALQPQNKRTLKKGTKDTYLLIGAKTPAVIVECGFMSNDAELKCLLDEEYQNKMAFAVYCGIMNYLLKE